MDNYDLTDDERELARMVRDFADEVVAPRAYEADRTHDAAARHRRADGRAGPVRPAVPRGVRRAGRRLLRAVPRDRGARPRRPVARDHARGRRRASAPCRCSASAPRSRSRSCCPTCSRARALAGFGLTEPEAGSDAGATRTTARLDGGEWVINGSKQFITNSGTTITRFVTVTAVTGEQRRPQGDLDDHGARTARPGSPSRPAYDKVGWNASDTHPLTFQDARVPEANLLGERGRGFANFLHILDEGRIAIAALSTGAAEGCLEAAVDYAKKRTVFGEALVDAPAHPVHARPHAGARAQRAARAGTTPPGCATPASRSRPRPRSPSSRRARPRWTTPATRRRSSAATGS